MGVAPQVYYRVGHYSKFIDINFMKKYILTAVIFLLTGFVVATLINAPGIGTEKATPR